MLFRSVEVDAGMNAMILQGADHFEAGAIADVREAFPSVAADEISGEREPADEAPGPEAGAGQGSRGDETLFGRIK